MKLGFIGLGAMGAPMARRLLAAGHTLSVHNRTAERAAPFGALGAVAAATPREAAQEAEAVVTMLADDAAVEASVLGPDGLAAGLSPGALHIGCSTISPALSARLAAAHAARGQHYLSATVLGRPPAAETGTLFIVQAGPEPARVIAAPVLDVLGQRVFTLGDAAEQANLVKLCLNFLIFSTIEQMAEVFAVGEKGGVAPAQLFDILTNSFFNAPVHRNYGQLIVDGAFHPPGAALGLGMKDNTLMLEAAEDLLTPMPMASLLRDRFLASLSRGESGLDFAALSRRAREDAGLGGMP